MGAVTGKRGTLIVEGGASPEHARGFLAGVAELKAAPARVAAVTHWHWDHTFGIGALGLPTIGHRETWRKVAEMASLDWSDAALDGRVARGEERSFLADHIKIEMTDAERAALVVTPPDLIFDDEIEVDLGEITARIIHVGGDHTPDSSIVFIPEERAVFLGDCLYNGTVGETGWYYTTRSLFPLLNLLLGLDAEHYVIAHAPAPLARAEFVRQAEELRLIGEVVTQNGEDREASVSQLEEAFGEPLDADRMDNLDCFIRGIQLGLA
jgi:glyoxylase-like metal-dependent hydrolase (beta-lactamase superfamily II)